MDSGPWAICSAVYITHKICEIIHIRQCDIGTKGTWRQSQQQHDAGATFSLFPFFVYFFHILNHYVIFHILKSCISFKILKKQKKLFFLIRQQQTNKQTNTDTNKQQQHRQMVNIKRNTFYSLTLIFISFIDILIIDYSFIVILFLL